MYLCSCIFPPSHTGLLFIIGRFHGHGWISFSVLICLLKSQCYRGSRPSHLVHYQILEVLDDDLGSVGASVVILEDSIKSQIMAEPMLVC